MTDKTPMLTKFFTDLKEKPIHALIDAAIRGTVNAGIVGAFYTGYWLNPTTEPGFMRWLGSATVGIVALWVTDFIGGMLKFSNPDQ